MFDLGWSEMLVIGVVALIIIGPKDLPKVIKQVSQWIRYLRGMAREFQSGVDDMVRDSDLDEARKALDFARDVNPRNQLKKLIDPDDQLERDLDIEGDLRGDYDDDLFDDGIVDDFDPNAAENSGPIESLKEAKEPAAKKAPAKKTPAKKASAKTAPSKKVPAKKAPESKAVSKKPAEKKAASKANAAKKAAPKKTTAKPKAKTAKKSDA